MIRASPVGTPLGPAPRSTTPETVPPSPRSPPATSSSDSGIWARLSRPCAGAVPPKRPSAIMNPLPKPSWVFCSAQPPSGVFSSTARRGISMSRPP